MWRAVLKWLANPRWDGEVSRRSPSLRVDAVGRCERQPDGFPHEEAIRRVLHRYATVLELPFTFRAGQGHNSPPAPPDGIHVHAFAVPGPAIVFSRWSRAATSLHPFAYGVPLRDGIQDVLMLGMWSGWGHGVVDADGRVVAACHGTNLYCLFDLLRQEPVRVPLLLRRHLDLGLPRALAALVGTRRGKDWENELRLLEEETAAEVREGRQRLHALARDAYILVQREGTAEEIRFVQRDIAFLDASMEEMGRRIAAKTRQLTDGRRRLRILQGGEEEPEPPGPDLAAVRALSAVREVWRREGGVTIVTEPVLVEYEGHQYRLGVFEMDLFENGDVRIRNLSDRIGRFDHPHVCEGRPRLAGVREGVAKLLGESQIVAAAEVLLDFLKTVHPTDWYQPIQAWPEVSRESAPAPVVAA